MMKGIKLVTIGLISWLIFTVVAIILGLSAFSMEKSIETRDFAQNLSMRYQDLASDLLNTSDYLTDEARTFAVTRDKRHLSNYLQQLEVTKTREKTLEQIKKLGTESEEIELVERAKSDSDKLVLVEIHALRLVLEAQGVAENNMPSPIRAQALSIEEIGLTPTGKLEKARLLLFDSQYEANRKEAFQSISDFKQVVRLRLLKEEKSADLSTSGSLNLQIILALIVLVAIAGVLIIIYLEMTRPIEGYIKTLENNNEEGVNLVPMGTKEMRVLAETFNQRTNLLYAAQQELTKLATTDFLTGSSNRRMFLELGEKEVRRAERYGHPLSVLMLDVDHFKSVNDGYGHCCGDQVLQFLVRKGQEILRPSDILGRLGGEEFAVILPETDSETAFKVAERLRLAYEQASFRTDDGNKMGVTVSIGVVSRQPGELGMENILNRADKALYLAKNSGRNCCVLGA